MWRSSVQTCSAACRHTTTPVSSNYAVNHTSLLHNTYRELRVTQLQPRYMFVNRASWISTSCLILHTDTIQPALCWQQL